MLQTLQRRIKFIGVILSDKHTRMVIIAEGGLLLSQERTYKRKEKTKTMGASLEKKER